MTHAPALVSRPQTTEVVTRDPAEARSIVAAAFCDHSLRAVAGEVDCRFRLTRIGRLGAGKLDYGRAVEITPRSLDSFYLVQMPVRGTAEVTCGGTTVTSTSLRASVLSPGLPVQMRWGADNPQRVVHLPKDEVDRELVRLLGRPPSEPLRFDPAVVLDQGTGAAWAGAVAGLADALRSSRQLGDDRLLEGWDRVLLSQALLCLPHNHSAALREDRPALTGTVRLAVEVMEGHYAEPLTIGDVAEAVGASARALQEGFQRQLDTTPMAWLRDRRLRAAREQLERALPGTSVTDIALSCGFMHLGRFATTYKEAYGESPSAVLRRHAA